jgi:RNA polymerase sigma-70 factor (ECF subfamily)
LEPSDLELWQSAARGDHKAFHTLVDRHSRGMFRLALSMSGSRSDAEDICQETFVGAFKSLKSFDGRASVKTWLTRILIRRAAKIWNKQKHDRRTLSLDRESDAGEGRLENAGISVGDRVSVASAVSAVDQRLDLMEVIRTLAPEFRDTVILREVEGLSYQEIADALNVPRGTVESRLYRARAELRKKLTGY